MIRLSTLFWLVLVAASGAAMFTVKYRVQAIEHQLLRTERTTVATQRRLRVLNAEWAYLNRPATLAQLNARFLSLVPITTKELRASFADLPMRPPAVPEALVASQTSPRPHGRHAVVTAMLEHSATAAALNLAPARAARAEDAAPHSLNALIARIAARR